MKFTNNMICTQIGSNMDQEKVVTHPLDPIKERKINNNFVFLHLTSTGLLNRVKVELRR